MDLARRPPLRGGHRHARRLAMAVGVLCLALGPSPRPAAAQGDVAFEVLPSPVRVAGSGSGQLAAVVRNGSDIAMSGIAVGASGDTGVQVQVRREGARRLAPGASTVWRLEVRQGQPGVLPQQLLLQVTYRQKGLRGILVDDVEVVNQEPDKVERFATVEVQSGLGTIDDIRSGDLYLLVRNLMSAPAVVTTVELAKPGFINLERRSAEGCPGPQAPEQASPDRLNCRIAPGDVLTIPYHVSAADVTRTGNEALLFTIRLDTGSPSRKLVLTASHEVTVGLFGESELGRLVQVPSILLLPGFIAVVVVSLLWRGGARPNPLWAKEFPYGLTTAEFWVIVFAVDVLLFLIYARASGVTLESVTVRDTVWLVGIGVGAAVLLWGGGALLWRWRAARRTPRDGDDAETALIRLGRRRVGQRLPVVEADSRRLLELVAAPSSVVLAPQIVYDLRVPDIALEDSITTAMGRPTVKELSEVLVRGSREGKLVLKWRATDDVNGPFTVAADKVTRRGYSDNLVVWDPRANGGSG